MDRSEVKHLLKQAGLHPSKERGQNFLLDESVLQDMAQAADLKPSDLVVEVGPGLGVLTALLSQKTKAVFAIELDHGLARYLASSFLPKHANVTLHEGDALSSGAYHALIAWLEQHKAAPKGYKVVANVPYQITSRLLRHFAELRPQPAGLVLMVQKEVAQRATAKPGDMSLLSLMLQAEGSAHVVQIVPASAFEPEPEVDSAILAVDLTKPHAGYAALADDERQRFWRLARAAFSSRRKQMKNNLGSLGLDLKAILAAFRAVGLDERVRAQELSLDQWVALAKTLTF